jgi:hypothetical protein
MSGDEEADGAPADPGRCLRAVVAVLRNHAEIVLAHVDRESPKSAALPFPQGSHSVGRCCHVFSLRGSRIVHGNGL